MKKRRVKKIKVSGVAYTVWEDDNGEGVFLRRDQIVSYISYELLDALNLLVKEKGIKVRF